MSLLFIWITSIRFNTNRSVVLFKRKKNSFILKLLQARYDHLVPAKFTPNHIDQVDERSLPVWIFWYQGLDYMPDIVKMCYKSVCNNSDGRPIHLLTKDNLADYIELPDYIMTKVEHGCVTLTHLSDIIRVSLLYRYGGHWVDSTIFTTSPLFVKGVNPIFDSIKIHAQTVGEISDYRWAGFYLFSYPNSEAMKCFRDVMLAYWADGHKRIIDYLLIDFTFEMLYQKNEEFKALIDNKQYRNEDIYSLISVLNNEYYYGYDKEWGDTTVFKLNWRFTPRQGDSIYNYLLKNTN